MYKLVFLLHTTLIITVNSISQNVGIGTTTPQQKLEVSGKIKIHDDNQPPQPGTIRWNETAQDFEGYNGSSWLSLTLSNTTNWPQPGGGLGTVTNFTQHSSTNLATDYGYSVAMYNKYAVVGAPLETSNSAVHGGGAYVYKTSDNGNTWQMITRLIAPNNPDGTADKFGLSVAVSHNLIAIGAPYRNDGRGSIFIFKTTDNGSTWLQSAELTAPSGADGDNLGFAIALDSNLLVAGATGVEGAVVTNNLPNDGAVYVFRTTDGGTIWSRQIVQQPLGGNQYSASTSLGASVAINDSIILIGAPGYDEGFGYEDVGSILSLKSTNNGVTWTNQSSNTGFPPGCFKGRCLASNDGLQISKQYKGPSGSTYNRIFFSKLNPNNSSTSYTLSSTSTSGSNMPSTINRQGQMACGDNLFLICWPQETLNNACGNVAANVKGIVKVYKEIGGVYTEYCDITDPLVAATDNNSNTDMNVAVYNGRFIIGLPKADVNNTTDKGKVIFGKIQ